MIISTALIIITIIIAMATIAVMDLGAHDHGDDRDKNAPGPSSTGLSPTTSDEPQVSHSRPSVSDSRTGPSIDPVEPLPQEADGDGFNGAERTCILMAIDVARSRLSMLEKRETMTEELANETRKILSGPRYSALMKKLPTARVIRDIEHSFWEYGKLEPVKEAAKPKELDTEPKIEGLIAIQKSRFAKRNKAEVAEVCLMMAKQMLKEKKKFYFRSIYGDEPHLTKSHVEQRLSFGSKMMELINEKKLDPDDICFTGEAMIATGPFEDWQSPDKWLPQVITKDNIDAIRALENQKAASKDNQSTCFKLVQAKAGVVGPYFIETMTPREGVDKKREDGEWTINLDGPRYLELLRDHVIPELKSRLSAGDWAKCWWLQDDRPAHQTDQVRDYLKSQFGDRVLSANSKYSFPGCSRDLNMLDYFYWDVMRVLVGDKRPKTLAAVRKGCQEAEKSMNWRSTLRAIREWPLRIGCLIENKGIHVEDYLQDFKRRTKPGQEEPCEVCSGSHPCPDCDTCFSQCLENLSKLKARQHAQTNRPRQQPGPSSRA